MKLYEVPRNTKVRVRENFASPPGAPELKKGDEIMFHHVDGMYSYCTRDGEVVHLAAWADVEVIEDA